MCAAGTKRRTEPNLAIGHPRPRRANTGSSSIHRNLIGSSAPAPTRHSSHHTGTVAYVAHMHDAETWLERQPNDRCASPADAHSVGHPVPCPMQSILADQVVAQSNAHHPPQLVAAADTSSHWPASGALASCAAHVARSSAPAADV